MSYSFILLCAGIGNRMKQSVPKQYLLLSGKQIFLHSLEKIDEIDEISEVIIVASSMYFNTIKQLLENRAFTKKVIFVEGGSTRQESVYNGLRQVSSKKVIIHEAARPFVSSDDYRKLINTEYDNVTFACGIPFTVVTKSDRFLDGVLSRDSLLNIQLPQKFDVKMLLEAHSVAKSRNQTFTDDTSLLISCSPHRVMHIEGSDYNIKITTQFDLLIAEQIYSSIFMGRETL